MKNKITLSLLLSMLGLPAMASTPAYIAPKAIQAPVLDLAYNGNKLMGVGARGHLLALMDDQWQQLQTPSSALFTGVTFAGKNGWAVGHDATIIITKDGGQNWRLTQSLPELDKPLLDVMAITPTKILAVGAYGMAYVSQNGGSSWTPQFYGELLHPDDLAYLDELKLEDPEFYEEERSAMLPHFNRLSKLRDGRLVMVGEMGLLALSMDQGDSWQAINPFYDGSLFDFIEIERGSWLAVGLRGNIFRSEDQGQTWYAINTDVRSTINSVVQLMSGDIVMVANSGHVLLSKDDGNSFVSDLVAKGEDLVSVAERRDGRVAVSGSAGVHWLNL
ncbi:MAG: YCF48-related protein [Ferrimonas sp.]